MWAANGVALCTAQPSAQYTPTITSDDAGGAIVTWFDFRSGTSPDIYAQRVNASGTAVWAANGVALCTAVLDQQHPTIAPDGTGGAIVTWFDSRSGNQDIYAQRVDTSGTALWTADGVALCTATGGQQYPTITSDGAGGAIVTWQDYRSGNYDIYTQSVKATGLIGDLNPYPMILSVRDVPGDQGGWVRIGLESSGYDDETYGDNAISTYNVWKRVDDPALLAVFGKRAEAGAPGPTKEEERDDLSARVSSLSAWPLREDEDRIFVDSRELIGASDLPPGTWELLGSFAACQQEEYLYRASTLADSTADGIAWSVYMVSAHSAMPWHWYASNPDSGYSVDNLSPEPPAGLGGEQSYELEGLALSWEMSAANDLSHYAVYRGPSEEFEPAPENRIASPREAGCFDGEWRWGSGYYYKVSAVDVHGNESGFALLRPEEITGTETPRAPEASYLSQNFPNPFNPMTKIVFGLSAPAHVSLRIYEASGRLVRELVNEARPAARYEEVWDGRDGAQRQVSSGIYFYRLDAGSFTETKKMILLR